MLHVPLSKAVTSLVLVALALSSAGCANRDIVPTTPLGASVSQHDAFSGVIKTKATSEGVTCKKGKRTGYGIKYKGHGHLAILSRTVLEGVLINCPAGVSETWSGPTKLISTWAPANVLDPSTSMDVLDIKMIFTTPDNPCGQTGSWKVTGGTGRFKGAKGGGKVSLTCSTTGAADFKFAGQLTP